MRPLHPLLLGTVLIVCTIGSTLAQTAPGAPPPDGRADAIPASPATPGAAARPARRGPPGPAGMFARIDANGDGRVTFDEVWSFAEARYGEADRNRDGALVLEEVLAFRPMPPPEGAPMPPPDPRHARMAAAIFRAVDVNGDRRVVLEEIRPALEAQFRAMDVNGDRGVTLDELPMGGRGPHRGPHDRMHGAPMHGGHAAPPRP